MLETPFALRVQNRRSPEDLRAVVGKMLLDRDTAYGAMLTGHTRVTMPNGKLLCHYLPRALANLDTDETWDFLSSVKIKTTNRSTATGSETYTDPGYKRKYYKAAYSGTIGYLEANGRQTTLQFCRLTDWTRSHPQYMEQARPILDAVHELMKTYEAERYGVQRRLADETEPAFVIEGTPWTTITHNHTYPTGVHVDKGDLDAGVSVIATFTRRSEGAELCFPEWGVAAPMRSGDVILMDAHQYHGNLPLVVDGTPIDGLDAANEVIERGFGRVSLVFYFRTLMASCGTEEEERLKQEMENAQTQRKRADFRVAAGG